MKAGDTIINTTSVDAYVGPGPSLDRTATQGAIVSFTRGLSTQLLSKGIRVNAVAPGPIWSALVVANMDEHHREKFSSTPMGRAGMPEEAASCYVFLASNDSSFISGQTMHPNGGIIVNG
jgi:NAD(P)-dependent dehydrogenase (short-subunit alcohol dehydrogenase family)